MYDVHATVLHLPGVAHAKLTSRHNGIDRSLTDVHGHVLGGTLAGVVRVPLDVLWCSQVEAVG